VVPRDEKRLKLLSRGGKGTGEQQVYPLHNIAVKVGHGVDGHGGKVRGCR